MSGFPDDARSYRLISSGIDVIQRVRARYRQRLPPAMPSESTAETLSEQTAISSA